MKRKILGLAYLFILAGFMGGNHPAHADSDTRLNLPLVYEPTTKKYFIGKDAKFILKQNETSSVLDMIEVAVDAGEFQPYGNAIQFNEEGKHTLRFRAKNPVNNWSPVQFAEVFVDLTPPRTEVKWSDNGVHEAGEDGLFFARGTAINLLAQDNLSGIGKIEFSWDDGSYVPFLKPIIVDKMGKQTLYYRSVDKVGNIEPARKLTFVGDGSAPVSSMRLDGLGKQVTMDGKSTLAISDATGVTFESSDDASAVKQILVSVDGAPFAPYLKTMYFLKDGKHTLRYGAVDNVGNREGVKSIELYTISQAPRTEAIPLGRVVNTGGVNFAPMGFQLKLTAKDNIVGLDRIEVKVDTESDFRNYVEPVRFTSAGMHQVNYRSVDRAGNTEPTHTYNVMIQAEAPETEMNTSIPLVLRDGTSYSPSPNVVSFSVTNSTVGIEATYVSLNDGPFQPYKSPITLTSNRKVHKIAYRSVDRLGIAESPKTINVNMIATNPVIDLFVSDGRSAEEQLRTNFFDSPGTAKEREPAANKR